MQWILTACLLLGIGAHGELLGSDLTIQKATRYVISLLHLLSSIRQGLRSQVHVPSPISAGCAGRTGLPDGCYNRDTGG